MSELQSNEKQHSDNGTQPAKCGSDSQTTEAWRDKVIEQILVIRNEGLTNMFDTKNVFELAVSKDFNELADFIFTNTSAYSKFILTGTRSVLVKVSI